MTFPLRFVSLISGLLLSSSVIWAAELPTDVYPWETTRQVDLQALRQKSIEAYLEGREYTSLYGTGVDPGDLTLLCAIGVGLLGLGLSVASAGLNGALMHAFYKLHEVKPGDSRYKATGH